MRNNLKVLQVFYTFSLPLQAEKIWVTTWKQNKNCERANYSCRI